MASLPFDSSDPEAYRKRLAAVMTQGATDTAPIQSWTQGLARMAQALIGANMMNSLGEERGKMDAELRAARMTLPGLEQAAAPAASPMVAALTSGAPRVAAANTTGKIYEADEPSPLDPPDGTDRDRLVRTILAEAGNQGPVGMNAVASTVRNRAVAGNFGGDTPSQVVTARNQFEPWNTAEGRARMAAIDPASKQYAAANQAVDSAYAGNDPTNGAVNFIEPKLQVALGRKIPQWAQGPGQDIGDHRFFGGATDPAALPPNAQAAQGFVVPGQPAPAQAPVDPRSAPAVAPQVAGQIRQYLGSKDPRLQALGMKLYEQHVAPQKPIEINGKLVDPRTFRVVGDFSTPKQQTSDIQEYEYAKKEGFAGNLTEFLQRKRSGAGEYGMQPIYGVDAEGKPVIMQLGRGGEAIQSKLPGGVTIAKDPIKVDTGTHFILLDPVTRQPIGQPIAKNIAGVEIQKAAGEAQGQAQASLPITENKADLALKTINQIRAHPGRNSVFGVGKLGWVPGIPGTEQKGFVTLIDQAKGQTFLQAFESLKGGGQITEVEGVKATQALARLDRAQSEADFNAALKDYEDVIKSGVARARQQAGGGGKQQQSAPAQSVDDLLKKYGS